MTSEESSLLTHIATTESVSLWHADEKLTAFMELESAICAPNIERKLKMKTLLTIITAALLGACATPYMKTGFPGGYSDSQLAPNMFRVTFGGNSFTGSDRTQDFALLRAAELTLVRGYRYFTLLNDVSDGVNVSGLPKPSNSLLIECFNERPASGRSFDAQFLSRSIRAKYKLPS